MLAVLPPIQIVVSNYLFDKQSLKFRIIWALHSDLKNLIAKSMKGLTSENLVIIINMVAQFFIGVLLI